MKKVTILLLITLGCFATACNDKELSDSEDYVNRAKQLLTAVGTAVPPAAPWTTLGVGALGLAGTVISAFRGSKHKKRANDYRDGIEAAISNGSDQTVAEVKVIQEVLDTDTKKHFNESGLNRL